MKICLGLINKNDKFFLERHLPIIRPCFDGAVVVDAESTDGSQAVLKKHGFTIIGRPWTNHFADARNMVIKIAEDLKYTHIFFLDADECMFPEDIETVKKYLENKDFIWLPRIEFEKDYQHFYPQLYPDFQGRVFKLGVFYHYQNAIHEMVRKGEDKVEAAKATTEPSMRAVDCPIYHYGGCASKEKLWIKYRNYERLNKGLPPISEIPEGTVINEGEWWGDKMRIFRGRQPLFKG